MKIFKVLVVALSIASASCQAAQSIIDLLAEKPARQSMCTYTIITPQEGVKTVKAPTGSTVSALIAALIRTTKDPLLATYVVQQRGYNCTFGSVAAADGLLELVGATGCLAVKTITGKTYTLAHDRSDTLESLRERISAILDIPAKQILLLARTNDGETMYLTDGQYISPGTRELNVILRLRREGETDSVAAAAPANQAPSATLARLGAAAVRLS